MISLVTKEIIGDPSCPILHRWTLIPWGERIHENEDARWKLLVHHFLPSADDRDIHDHPRGFCTLVLRGGYDDMKQCACQTGEGPLFGLPDDHDEGPYCFHCQNRGVVLRERMLPGMIRYRPAEHAHRTKVHASGCWTIVVMGPIVRRWGFWRGKKWMYWRDYQDQFGHGMRCE